jgi:hypothetical protein
VRYNSVVCLAIRGNTRHLRLDDVNQTVAHPLPYSQQSVPFQTIVDETTLLKSLTYRAVAHAVQCVLTDTVLIPFDTPANLEGGSSCALYVQVYSDSGLKVSLKNVVIIVSAFFVAC